MKKHFALLLMLIAYTSCLIAQNKTIKMGTTKIEIAGNQVSDIKLVNAMGKELGNLFTYTSVADNEIIFSQYQNYKTEGINFVSIQRFTINATIGLIAEVEVKKSFIDPELKTNPKQYWDVAISFKPKNNEYFDVGATAEYRISYSTGKPTTVKENFIGTSRLLPFATKKAAEEFANKVKNALNKKA
jgi:hypothetical protein